MPATAQPQQRKIQPAQVVRNTAATAAAMGTPAQVVNTVAGNVQRFDVNVDPHFRDLASYWSESGNGQTVSVPDQLAHKRTAFFADVLARAASGEAEVETAAPKEGEDVRLTATINTNEIDRYDTIIEPRGCEAENFAKNPVLLWAHGLDPKEGTIAIGQVTALRIFDDRIEVDLEFFGDTEPGNRIGQMYAKKQLRGFSIGFIPKSYHVEMIDEKQIIRFVLWELVELSAVSVPANASALAREIEQRQVTFSDQRLADYVGGACRAATGGGDVIDFICGRYGMPALNTSQQVHAIATIATNAPPAAGMHGGQSRQQPGLPAAPNQQQPPAGDVRVPAMLARSLDGLLAAVGQEGGVERGDANAVQRTVQILGDLAATRGQITRGDLANITARLAADLRVDWDGLFVPGEVCRGLQPSQIEELAAVVVADDVARTPRFVHHRADGSISWPALGGCMAEVVSGHCGLTAEGHSLAYEHLAAHYRSLGIAPPEFRYHTPEEIYDLSLAGVIACERSGSSWLFASVHQRADGAVVPMFRDVQMQRTAEFEVPGLGRLTNPELWGKRALPDNRGMETLLQQLQETQSRLLDAQTSAGASFTVHGRNQLTQLADGLAGASQALKQAATGIDESLAFVRGIVSDDGTGQGGVSIPVAGGSPATVGIIAASQPVDQRMNQQPANAPAAAVQLANPMAAVQQEFTREMVTGDNGQPLIDRSMAPVGELANDVFGAQPTAPAT